MSNGLEVAGCLEFPENALSIRLGDDKSSLPSLLLALDECPVVGRLKKVQTLTLFCKSSDLKKLKLKKGYMPKL